MKAIKFIRFLLLLAVVALLVGLSSFIANIGDNNSSNSVTLPPSGRIKLINTNTYIYGSNDVLETLLTTLDIHFKSQDLSSDIDSPVFEYPQLSTGPDTGIRMQTKIDTCYEFDYFKNKQVLATFTLVPTDAICYTNNEDLLEDIAQLHSKYQHIYIIKVDNIQITD